MKTNAKANENFVVTKLSEGDSQQMLFGKEEEKVVCEVCGYANDKNVLICKMCSNYLTK